MKFDLFYEMMMPPEWDEGVERKMFDECIEQLMYADELGFNTVWLARHYAAAGFSHSPSPEVFFGYLAARTKNLRLGFGVELMPMAHPIEIAGRVALVDQLSAGRVEFAANGSKIDAGQLALMGVDPTTSAEKGLESLKVLPQLWADRDVVHNGKFFQWEQETTVVPRPVQQPHPPMWVAASRQESVLQAARRGLGLLAGSYRSSWRELGDDIAAYKEAAKNPTEMIGKVANDQVSLLLIVICHEKGDEAAAARARKAALNFVQIIRLAFVDTQGLIAEEINSKSDDELLTRLGLVGDKDYVAEGLRMVQAMGVDRVMLLTQLDGVTHEDVMCSHRLISELMPQFETAGEVGEMIGQ